MHVIEYESEHRKSVVELLSELQDFERGLSRDRESGQAMADGHFEYLLDMCAAHSGKVFLATEGPNVVGFIVVFLQADDNGDLHLIPKYRLCGWISDLTVTERHRGSDAASLLVDRAERHCSSIGVHQVKLASLYENRRARSFYQKLGYEEYEVIYRKDI